MPLKLAATALLAASSVGALATECADDVCTNEEAAMLQVKAKKSGFLPALSLNVAKHFVTFPDYEGDLHVSGFVIVGNRTYPDASGEVDDSMRGQILTWFLNGVDPRCDHGPGSCETNSCGVVITEGNCEEAGHHHSWWYDCARSTDPWACSAYTSYHAFHKNRTSLGNFEVLTGYDDPVGRSVVIYDYEGNGIGCAVIKNLLDPHHGHHDDDDDVETRRMEKKLTACATAANTAGDYDVNACMMKTMEDAAVSADAKNFFGSRHYCVNEWAEIDGYDGSLHPVPEVKGSLDISDALSLGAFRNPAIKGQRLSWSLTGLDEGCDEGRSSPGSCMVKIVHGSCESQGYPFVNDTLRGENPWPCVTYTAVGGNSSTPQCGGQPVLTGLPTKDAKGLVVVLTDSEGYVYSCGEIQEGKCAHLPLPEPHADRAVKRHA